MADRKFKRRHLFLYLRVFDADSGELIGHLVDITIAGCMIISDKEIKANTKLKLKMDLPDVIIISKELVLKTESIWSKKDINPDFFVTGFKFETISHKDIDTINTMIKVIGFKDMDEDVDSIFG